MFYKHPNLINISYLHERDTTQLLLNSMPNDTLAVSSSIVWYWSMCSLTYVRKLQPRWCWLEFFEEVRKWHPDNKSILSNHINVNHKILGWHWSEAEVEQVSSKTQWLSCSLGQLYVITSWNGAHNFEHWAFYCLVLHASTLSPPSQNGCNMQLEPMLKPLIRYYVLSRNLTHHYLRHFSFFGWLFPCFHTKMFKYIYIRMLPHYITNITSIHK